MLLDSTRPLLTTPRHAPPRQTMAAPRPAVPRDAVPWRASCGGSGCSCTLHGAHGSLAVAVAAQGPDPSLGQALCIHTVGYTLHFYTILYIYPSLGQPLEGRREGRRGGSGADQKAHRAGAGRAAAGGGAWGGAYQLSTRIGTPCLGHDVMWRSASATASGWREMKRNEVGGRSSAYEGAE